LGQGTPGPVAWFSLEARDNDPLRFWRYFTAALQTALPAAKFPTPFTVPQFGPGILPSSLTFSPLTDGILHRHLPASERDHTTTMSDASLMQTSRLNSSIPQPCLWVTR
jgi:hypothetical protein